MPYSMNKEAAYSLPSLNSNTLINVIVKMNSFLLHRNFIVLTLHHEQAWSEG